MVADSGQRFGRVLTALVAVAVLAALPACGGSTPRRSGVAPQSLVLVTVGGLRADRVNAYLYRKPTTYAVSSREERRQGGDLSVDSVIAQGVSFSNAFAPGGGAAAGIVTLLTGLHPLASCVFTAQDGPASEAPTLAQRFLEAGFQTAAFAAGVDLGAGEPWALGRGFEHTASGEVGRADESVVESAREWVAALGDGERFFLWLHVRGTGDLPEGDVADATYDELLARTSGRISGFLRFLAGHQGSTNHLVSAALVLTAPSAMELGERGGYVGQRKTLSDAGLRVPLVLRHPGSLTGRRVFSEVIGLERVAPTLADWFELTPLDTSASLLPFVDGDVPPDSDAAAVATRAGRVYSLRDERWRLVWNPGGRFVDEERPVPEFALYDIAADPRELHDRSAERPEEVRRLVSRVLARLAAYGGECLPDGELDELRGLTPP